MAYQNQELATYFYDILKHSQEFYPSQFNHEQKRDYVSSRNIRLSKYVEEHGSLKGLALEPLDSKSIKLLEDIIKHGFGNTLIKKVKEGKCIL